MVSSDEVEHAAAAVTKALGGFLGGVVEVAKDVVESGRGVLDRLDRGVRGRVDHARPDVRAAGLDAERAVLDRLGALWHERLLPVLDEAVSRAATLRRVFAREPVGLMLPYELRIE